MSNTLHDDEKPLDPAAARIVAKVRSLMLVGAATLFIGIAAVPGVIGYRVFRSEGSAPVAADVTAQLPAGARIMSTAVSDGRIVVTVDIGGIVEVRSYDLRSLKQLGRLTFTTAP